MMSILYLHHTYIHVQYVTWVRSGNSTAHPCMYLENLCTSVHVAGESPEYLSPASKGVTEACLGRGG